MEFGLFGPLEIREGERRLRVPGGRTHALLGVLLLESGNVLPAQRLVELLWPQDPPATARESLHVLIAGLRAVLEPAGPPYRFIRTQSPGYVLEVDPDDIDIRRFEGLAATGRAALAAGQARAAAASLAGALALCRGPALAGMETEVWAIAEARRLEELRLLATEDRVAADLELGVALDLVPELLYLVEKHPMRERLLAQLMLALYRSGRATEAADTFHQLRKRLVESRGMEPGPELQLLFRQVLTKAPELAAGQPPREVRANLPRRLVSLVGRKQALAMLIAQIERHPMVTLTGTGGIGKTSLALAAAAQAAQSYEDGSWLVALDSVSEPAMVPWAIVAALGLRGDLVSDPVGALKAHLRDRRCLLVIDNCEHVIDAAAEVIHALLEACSRVSVLATSREPLRLPEENVVPVPPLDARTDGVELFRERAAAAGASLEDLALAQPAIETICVRLAGIPLAIELVASWSADLGVDQLAFGLADSLAELGPARGRPERHRSLGAALDWTQRRLSEFEQVAFRRMAVFATASPEGAAAVLGIAPLQRKQVPELMSALVRRALAVEDHGPAGPRFRFLQPVREFARARLAAAGEEVVITDRFIAHMGGVAAAQGRKVRGRGHAGALRMLDAEEDNLRAALDLAVDAEPGLFETMTADLGDYWFMRGRVGEGIDRLRRATQARPHYGRAHTRALLALARLEIGVDVAAGRRAASAAATLAEAAGAHDLWGRALYYLAAAAYTTGELPSARELAIQATDLGRACGDVQGEGDALGALGVAELYAGENQRALDASSAAIALCESIGDAFGVADASLVAADAALALGDVELSRKLIRASIAGFEAMGERNSWIFANGFYGKLAMRTGDTVSAQAALERAMEAARLTSNTYAETLTGAAFGELAVIRGDDQAALAWWAEVVRLELERGSAAAAVRARLAQSAMAAQSLPRVDHRALLEDARRIAADHQLDALLPEIAAAAASGTGS